MSLFILVICFALSNLKLMLIVTGTKFCSSKFRKSSV